MMLGEKLGFSIGLNVFGPGLSIAHYGCIVVNSGARIGTNCRIDYFTPRDPERNPVPLHRFSLANHRFAFAIHSYVLLFNLAQYSRMFMLPVSIQ